MATYRIPVEEVFSWQKPVIAIQNDSPGSPAKGNRYIVDTSPTGDWVGHAKSIAWYDGLVWKFDVPVEGWFAYVDGLHAFYKYDGSNWVESFTSGSSGTSGSAGTSGTSGSAGSAGTSGSEGSSGSSGSSGTSAFVTYDSDLGAIIVTI